MPAVACKQENRGMNPHYVALAVSYDELRRRDWEERAAKKDPCLEIENEAWVVNKDLLETAKSRLDQVVRAAGLKKGGNETAIESVSKVSVAESTLEKQMAAADSAAKRAEIAIAKLNAAQDGWKQSSWKQNSWQENGWQQKEQGHKGGGHKGGGKTSNGKGKGKKDKAAIPYEEKW